MESEKSLKLYHASMEGFITDTEEFVVANDKEHAKDIIHKMYGGNSGGYRKDQIHVSEVEVDGYVIQVVPKTK